MTRTGRYTVAARVYDLISAERPVYRPGRLLGITGLRLHAGGSVLDLGCGTGLNHPLLVEAVGLTGAVVGLDRSPQMLDQAHRRARRHKWTQTRTVLADLVDGPGVDGFVAVITTYALSLVPHWERAWAAAINAVRPGGRAAVVDLVDRGGA